MKETNFGFLELEAIMNRTRASLSGFIYRMVNRKELAEEIFQETWLKVVQHLDAYDVSKPFEPWLFRIARNLCLNHLKARKRRESKAHLLAENPVQETGIFPHEQEKLARCLAKLPAKSREVVHLRFFQEMSLKDVSVVLNIPEGTVNSRIHRGLKHLRKLWEQRG